MTSDAITARNTANAQKSTGPKTAAGKAAVSQNARRHGATSKPDLTSVVAWARVILNAPDLAPSDLLSGDRRIEVALALAEAEARVGSAQAAINAFERGGQMAEKNISQAGAFNQRSKAQAPHKGGARGGRQHRLLKRYLREARGHRKRAFTAWIGFLKREAKSEGKVA
ncbi:MAG: hypothetical protein ABNH38_17990 [Tateyamaria sp.]|jgi:hypothetical protein|uniref:hypothetical protein n=1 Tax=Tateyamaria sp. TaxID=1929288 RepID=UPI0032DC1289